jgi:pyrimidine-nucleoside phosphorylase
VRDSELGIDSILRAKRAGEALSADQIGAFVAGVVDGSVTRAQAAAWLAFVFCRGMDAEETVALTRAMTDSGERLSWPAGDAPLVDKHSTGGVGDKVSLVLAPLWAELGARVPMISGRGLGHTGGTLDKLESIPGFRTDLSTRELHAALDAAGCFISGQTGELAPADRLLYALRNETSTVESIPLITASILSKKLAEGIDELVLDVKHGSGAFMKTEAAAAALRDSLVAVGNGAGVRTRAVLSDMNVPLGRAVGNALEVEEAVACLRGEGPEDLAALVCALIGDPRAPAVLQSGRAFARWERMVDAQGGDPSAPLHGAGCETLDLRADRSGEVLAADALEIGRAAFVLGAGRLRADDRVHLGVGVRLHKKPGEQVRAGDALASLIHAGRGVELAHAHLRAAYRVG